MAREPIFNVPAGVVAAIGLIVLVHGGLTWLVDDEQGRLKIMLAFIPARYSGLAAELPGGEPAAWWSLLTHQFVHGDLTHLVLNSAWLLAFGSPVAARIGSVRFALLFLACGVAGAAAFLAIRYGEAVPMVGASGAISGLMGAAFRFFFNGDEASGPGSVRDDPRSVQRMSLAETFGDRRVLMMIVTWIAANFVTAAMVYYLSAGAGIAWEAHLGGFLLGLLAFQLFDRPQILPQVPPDEERQTLH